MRVKIPKQLDSEERKLVEDLRALQSSVKVRRQWSLVRQTGNEGIAGGYALNDLPTLPHSRPPLVA